MHSWHVLSVWLHILAAAAWLGGMAFLVLVVVPWLKAARQGDSPFPAARFLAVTGTRFRAVGWGCFALLIVTGSFQLWVRGIGAGTLTTAAFWRSTYGVVLLAKLSAFGLVLICSAYHDFWVGPAAVTAMEQAPASERAVVLRRRASLLGRANALLALLIVALAVMLVRGPIW